MKFSPPPSGDRRPKGESGRLRIPTTPAALFRPAARTGRYLGGVSGLAGGKPALDLPRENGGLQTGCGPKRSGPAHGGSCPHALSFSGDTEGSQPAGIFNSYIKFDATPRLASRLRNRNPAVAICIAIGYKRNCRQSHLERVPFSVSGESKGMIAGRLLPPWHVSGPQQQ